VARRVGAVDGEPTVGRGLTSVALAAVVAGIAYRAAMVRSGWGVLESDEAVVGLMARSIIRGDLPTFFWGQRYGGTAEAYALAGVFSVAGSSVLAIRIVSVTFAAVAALLVWRIGRRLLGPLAGAVAGLTFWLWPLPNVFWSIKSRGFYWATIVAGLTFVLCVLRLAESPSRRRDAVVAGIAVGIGWWSAPQIAVFLVPAAALVLVRARSALRPLLVLGAPAAALAAAPWIVFNARHGFVSLDPPEVQVGAAGSYVEHLETFFVKGLPMALGLRLPFSELWSFASAKFVYLALLAVMVTVVLVKRQLLVAAGLAVFPLVHALSPLAHYVGEGRYLVYFVPWLALALATVATGRAGALVVVGAAAAVSLFAFVRVGEPPMPYASDRPVPERLGPLVADLERWGLTHAYADYWIAYRVVFESEEEVLVGTVPASVSRRRSYDRAVDRAARVAYLSLYDSAAMHRYRTQFTRLGIGWDERRSGKFSVLVPARPVRPADLPAL
jgi:hypothetical protein